MELISQFDSRILEFIQTHLKTPALDKLMPAVTYLGNNGFIWIALIVIFLITKKYRRSGVTLSAAIAFAFVLGDVVLKPLIQRVRPCNLNPHVALLIQRQTDYSFPSGHTGAAFAAAAVLWSIDRRFGAAVYILAAAIAFSRLYLYMHFPSDILGGMILGTLCGLAAVAANNVSKRSKSKKTRK